MFQGRCAIVVPLVLSPKALGLVYGTSFLGLSDEGSG